VLTAARVAPLTRNIRLIPAVTVTHTGENFRRGGFLSQDQRYERAKTFLRTAWELLHSWQGGEILADRDSGMFLAEADAGRFAHHDTHLEIAGRFNVPRSRAAR
jgi:hypothetical protein